MNSGAVWVLNVCLGNQSRRKKTEFKPAAEKLTLCHILLAVESLEKYIENLRFFKVRNPVQNV